MFPPGHRIRICNFVSEVKQKHQPVENTSQRKRKCLAPSASSKKARKCADSDSDSESIVTTSSIAIQIRSNIARWVRKQSCVKLKNLKENKQFAVRVTNVAKSDIISAAIRCNACNTTIYLHQKNKSIKSSPYLISNWTRHVKMCPKLDKKQASVQQSLVGFLSPPTHNLSDSASHCSYSPSTPDRASLQSTTSHTYSDSTSSYPSTPSTSDRSDLPSTSQNSDHQVFLNAPLSAPSPQ